MRNTILSSVRQSLCSARFWLGAVFIALVLFLTSMDAVTEALRSDTHWIALWICCAGAILTLACCLTKVWMTKWKATRIT